MQPIADYITHVPVAVEPSDDGIGVTLTAAGVAVQLSGRAQTGRLPDAVYCAIDTALNATALASGSNMPVALDPTVWLHRCRRCQAPFIALPRTRLCSDECRALAKHDAAIRSKAKRAGRAADERLGGSGSQRFVCAQCGKRSAAFRSTKLFCSTKCRVAAHRGAPAADPEPMTIEELDREIANAQRVLGALRMIGTSDPVFMRSLMERAMVLQAERRRSLLERADDLLRRPTRLPANRQRKPTATLEAKQSLVGPDGRPS